MCDKFRRIKEASGLGVLEICQNGRGIAGCRVFGRKKEKKSASRNRRFRYFEGFIEPPGSMKRPGALDFLRTAVSYDNHQVFEFLIPTVVSGSFTTLLLDLDTRFDTRRGFWCTISNPRPRLW
jgi:hypothetical protein